MRRVTVGGNLAPDHGLPVRQRLESIAIAINISMSSVGGHFLPSSISEKIFGVALVNHARQTGIDLMNDPLTVRFKDCDTPNAILDTFQEFTLAFDEVKNGDSRLVNFLRLIVDGLNVLPSYCACSSGANGVGLKVAMLSITIHQCINVYTR